MNTSGASAFKPFRAVLFDCALLSFLAGCLKVWLGSLFTNSMAFYLRSKEHTSAPLEKEVFDKWSPLRQVNR